MRSAGSDPRLLYAAAVDALNRGDWQAAQQAAVQAGQLVPDHPGLHFVAGVAALELQQLPRAVSHLQRASELNPMRADYAAQLARALVGARFFPDAQAMADRALALDPQDAMTLDTLGVVHSQLNAHGPALVAFRRAAGLVPTHPTYRFNLATALMYTGDLTAAEDEYEACLALDPTYWKAHLALAQLQRQDTGHNHVARLRSLLAVHAVDPGAQLYLHLALAKELEDLKQYPDAFGHLVAGKGSVHRQRGSSSARDAALFEAIHATTAAPLPGTDGFATEEPIFVLGLPRSGTTLVERILSSHSTVSSAGELQNFSNVLKRASGSTTRDLLDADTVRRSRALDWQHLGQAYLESTRPGTGRAARFIDKLPHNFLLAGFIARALPRARIVCLRRDPVDSCLSNFRQLFALQSPYYDYSFDLLDTGCYYLQFDRLMRHWDTQFPDRILTLDYETLVDAQEVSTRRLLEFCGLPFEEACLHFEDNEAPVATASAVQVRDPINRRYLQRWRRYETQLGPLLDLLQAGGIAIDRR